MRQLDIFELALLIEHADVHCSVVEGLADAHQLTLDALQFCFTERFTFCFIIIQDLLLHIYYFLSINQMYKVVLMEFEGFKYCRTAFLVH